MNPNHRYRARERMPIFNWSGQCWETVGWVEISDTFTASDYWLPSGEMVLLLSDGSGYVVDTVADPVAPELVAYNVGPMP
jgi:hypothetical protein